MAVESWRAVGLPALGVELVGEFVEGHVVAVEDVSGAVVDGVPCEDDGAVAPGFAEAVHGALGGDACGVVVLHLGAEGAGIE